MAYNGNFWDSAQTEAEPTIVPEKVHSTKPSESNETTMPISEIQPQGLLQDASDGFIPHEPREIVIKGSISVILFAALCGALLIGSPGFDLVDEFFNIIPMDCDGELVESDDGTYLCQSEFSDVFELELFDENGQEIVDATRQIAGVAIIVTMSLLYIFGVYAVYTKKTYMAHLGSENTVVLKSSWFNKPGKEKGRIHLTPASYLRVYVTRSRVTMENPHPTSSTHYEICSPNQPPLRVPSEFSRKKLIEVTGLPVRRDY